MATTHALLDSGQLTNTAAVIYTASGTGMVKTIILHNTETGSADTEEVEIYYLTAADDTTRMLKVAVGGNETFEWSLGHMIVLTNGQTLLGKSTTTTTVNYFIFGAEEA
jgi:hypothetical protein